MDREVDVSIQARVIREIIAHIAATEKIGKKLRDGTIQKELVEVKWQCPRKYNHEVIERKNFSMEILSKNGSDHKRVILQLHGGGYIAGMRNVFRHMAVLYSKISNQADVLTINYRVAPEHPYPAALEDSIEAYQWLLDNGYGGEIIVAGDSAGGGLGLALGHYLKDNRMQMPKAFIAMSPWTDLTLSGESFIFNYELDPLFGKSRETLLYNRTYVGNSDPKHPYLSPLFGNFAGFPPILIQVGSLEMLLSDSERVAIKANEAGVRVKYTVYPGMFHDFQMGMWLMKESKDAWKEVKYFLKVLDKLEEK